MLHNVGGIPLCPFTNNTNVVYRIWSLCNVIEAVLWSLSKDVFERCTSTGSEAFSLFICLDANEFVLLTFFSLIKTIYLRI